MSLNMKHNTVLFFILLSLTRLLDGQKPPFISADPKRPRPNERVTVQCRWKGAVTFVGLTKDKTNIQYYPNKSANDQFKVEIDANWRPADQVTTTKDANAKTITLSYLAKAGEKNSFRCSELAEKFNYNELTVEVIVPPNVTQIEVISASKNKSRFYANELVTILCTVSLGNPLTLDKDVVFTAPGDGPEEFTINKVQLQSATKTFELKRTMKVSSNGKAVECYASNDAGTSVVKRQYLTVLYGTRDIEMSVENTKLLENANVSAGGQIRCTADGNPRPNVAITVTKFPEKERSWAIKGARGVSQAVLTIPHNASFSRYFFSCNASNELDAKFMASIPVNIIAAPTTTTTTIPSTVTDAGNKNGSEAGRTGDEPPASAPTKMSAVFIGGGILGLLVLIILIAIIYFLVQRRKKTTTKAERVSELERDTGPYDIDDTYKSGGQHESYGASKDGRQSGLYYSDSLGGVNGQQHFPEPGDPCIEQQQQQHNLNYASLDFDETPRSRVPIVFQDTDKVDYAEIVSSAPFNYDDEHFYENVRHHNV